MKYCINCGKQIPRTSSFCSYCGSKQSVEESFEANTVVMETEPLMKIADIPQTVAHNVAHDKSKKGALVASVIRNSIILAVAIVMLIGAFFPTTCIDLEDGKYATILDTEMEIYEVDVNLSLNAFQYVTLFFDSFEDIDDYDDVSDLTEEGYEILEEFEDFDEDDFKDLSLKEKSLINKLFYIYLRVYTQLDMGGPSISLVFVSILSIVHIILSVALFVIALLNLLATFNIIKRAKAQIYTWVMALVTASPAMILATHYVAHIYLGGGMSAMAIWSIICSGLVVIMSMVFRYIFSSKDTARNIVARSIAMTLSVVVFCFAFAPVFSVRFKDYSRKLTVYHGADFFEGLAVSDEESDIFDEVAAKPKEAKKAYFKSMMITFTYMTVKEAKSDYGASVNANIMVHLLGAKFENYFLNFLAITIVFFIIAAICALIVLWQSLYFFATGKHIKTVVLISKICTAVAATVAMIMTIVLISVVAPYAQTYIGPSYHINISANIIIMVAFSIIAIFCPVTLIKKASKKRNLKVEIDNGSFEPQF